MVKKSKLLAALDAHKGRDYDAEKRKKQLKSGEKAKHKKLERKAQQAPENGLSEDEEAAAAVPLPESDLDEAEDSVSATAPAKTKSQKKANGAPPAVQAPMKDDDEDDEDEDDEEEEEDVALSELSEDEREDTVPHQRMTINNGPALLASTSRIALLRKHPLKERAPFHVHNSLISTLPAISSSVPDPNDDLVREQEFYKIAQAGVQEARSLLKKEGIPFSRPADYFAEMVKSEGHMERIHKKQYDEAADRKGREEARRQRDAKKFGKQTQIAKEQERAKQKRDTLDKIKDLKRSTLPPPTFPIIAIRSANKSHRTKRQPLRSNKRRRRRPLRCGRRSRAREVQNGP